MIVYGCRFPLLLRRKEDGIYEGECETCYELVGECYVHVIMDGEMMNLETEVQRLLIA